MRLSPYTSAEKAIAAADAGSIRQRWEYGRRLLVDDTMTTPAGNLRHGVAAKLTQAALKVGRKISEREIRRRVQCGRTYPTEAQIGQILADFGNWWQLMEAGFPPYPAPEGERPYDPRTTRELAKAHARSGADILPDPWEQRGLFERFADDTTLGAMKRYAEGQAELTERFARRSDERFAYLGELIKAVNGDLSKTYGEARAALEAALCPRMRNGPVRKLTRSRTFRRRPSTSNGISRQWYRSR
jgi:hypothetical protein